MTINIECQQDVSAQLLTNYIIITRSLRKSSFLQLQNQAVSLPYYSLGIRCVLRRVPVRYEDCHHQYRTFSLLVDISVPLGKLLLVLLYLVIRAFGGCLRHHNLSCSLY